MAAKENPTLTLTLILTLALTLTLTLTLTPTLTLTLTPTRLGEYRRPCLHEQGVARVVR